MDQEYYVSLLELQSGWGIGEAGLKAKWLHQTRSDAREKYETCARLARFEFQILLSPLNTCKTAVIIYSDTVGCVLRTPSSPTSFELAIGSAAAKPAIRSSPSSNKSPVGIVTGASVCWTSAGHRGALVQY